MGIIFTGPNTDPEGAELRRSIDLRAPGER